MVALQPGGHDGVQPWQAARLAQGGQQDVLLKAPVELFQHRALQGLARADAREHPALGQVQALGYFADGQAFQAFAGGHLQRHVHDGGLGQLAAFGLGFHASQFSTVVRRNSKTSGLRSQFCVRTID